MRRDESRAAIVAVLEDDAARMAWIERRRELLDREYRARKSAFLRGEQITDMRTGQPRDMEIDDVIGAETHAQWWERHCEEHGSR